MTRHDFYCAVGARIQAVRKEKGRGQKDIAAKLDLSRESISNIEGGRHALQLHVAVQLAEELGVSLMDLLPEQSTTTADVVPDARELFKARVLRGA